MIINEIRANEPGSNKAGEFVEIVNTGGTAANIGGWTISDGTSVRHTFAAGTMLNRDLAATRRRIWFPIYTASILLANSKVNRFNTTEVAYGMRCRLINVDSSVKIIREPSAIRVA